MAPLTLYSRRGCHLCERAWALLEPLCAELGLALDAVAIEGDAALEGAYGVRIPVLVHAGRELLAWPFTRAQARAVLARLVRT